MKKLGIVLVVIGVLLAIAIGVGFWLDRKARAMAEDEAEKRIVEVLPRMRSAEVKIEGFPFLADVLLFAAVDRLHVRLDDIDGAGVLVESVVLVVDKLRIDRDLLLGEKKLAVTGIDRAEVTARLTGDAISRVLKQQIELVGDKAKVHSHGFAIDASLKVNKRRVEVELTGAMPPEVAAVVLGRPLVFQLPPEEVLPCAPALRIVDSRLELGCTVTELPAGVKRALGQR